MNREPFKAIYFIVILFVLVGLTSASRIPSLTISEVNAASENQLGSVPSLLYFSSTTGGNAGGVSFRDEDIVSYDTQNGTFAMFFRGSGANLDKNANRDVDAFALLDDGSLLLSLSGDVAVDGFGAVDDSDILRFVPTSLGNNTSGTLELYFDGSDVGLTDPREDIDAITVMDDGRIVLSIFGAGQVTKRFGNTLNVLDEDLIAFVPTTLGENTSGYFELFARGGDFNLDTPEEDLTSVTVDETNPQNPDVYFSTYGSYDLGGLSGTYSDIINCQAAALANVSSCGSTTILFDGSTVLGFENERIDAFHAALDEEQAPSWQQISTSVAPTVLDGFAMAYDSDRNVVVLYGGGTSWPYSSETWEFDGINWSQVSTTTAPNARYGMTLVYDEVQDRMLLFGGSDAQDSELNETWAYVAAAWSQLSSAASPLARTGHAAVWDGISSQMLIHGGHERGSAFDDVWTFDGTNWTELSTTNPPAARTEHSLAISGSSLIVYGGRLADGTLSSELATLNLSTNTWTSSSGGDPGGRMKHAAVYWPEQGQAVLLGGTASDTESFANLVWTHDGSVWGFLADGPTIMQSRPTVAVYDGGNQQILVFTGTQTWVLK